MTAIYDRGGWPDAGPIDPSEHAHADWEKRTHALMRLLAGRRIATIDELRRSSASMTREEYESAGYYERILGSIERILIEKGVITREEVARKLAELAGE